MLSYLKNEEEIANLWTSYQQDQKFFYREVLSEIAESAQNKSVVAH